MAGQEYPVVRQFSNTCGLASMAMVFLHHAPQVEMFLLDLHEKHGPAQGKRGGKVDRDAAVIWAEGYLLLKAGTSARLANWLGRIGGEFDYDDFTVALGMVLDAARGRRAPALETALKYYRKHVIRKTLLAHYFAQFKTQHELKMLAFMFGFTPVPYPRDTMGTLYFDRHDPARDEKVAFIKQHLAHPNRAMLVGHGQSHWMVPHALFSSNGEVPLNVLGINDPLGSKTRLDLGGLDNTHVFYFFDCDAATIEERVRFLRDVLHV